MAVQTAGLNYNVEAFLNMIQFTEGTALYSDPYRVLVGGGTINDLSKHPNKVVTLSPTLKSSAAGAYQILKKTSDTLGLKNFSPQSQDWAAIQLIKGRKAYEDVVNGNFASAIAKCNKEWASLPGSPYGQPVKTLEQCLSFLKKFVAEKKKYSGAKKYSNRFAAVWGHIGSFILGH